MGFLDNAGTEMLWKKTKDLVDKIEIGGRNLLKGSKDFSVGVTVVNGCCDLSEKVGQFTVLKAKNFGDGHFYDPFAQTIPYESNTTYTLSFYAKADSEYAIHSYFYNIGTDDLYQDGDTILTISTAWKKYTITWTTMESSRATASVIPMRLMGDANTWCYIYGVKMEKGRKATDWTPAPEDLLPVNGTAVAADKLSTARTVSGGTDIVMNFNYDGSSDSNAYIDFYKSSAYVGNTNNYPYHRIAKIDLISKVAYDDYSMMLLITSPYVNGACGIVKINLRTNYTAKSNATIEWLVRTGFKDDSVQIGLYNQSGNTYADVFLKTQGGYNTMWVRSLGSGDRSSARRTWTLVSSTESNNTTSTDAGMSKECYLSIESAGTIIHEQAYSEIIFAKDSGKVLESTKTNAVVDYNDENRNIQIGFAGAGLAAGTLAYLAGYTSDGKIKDITIPNAKDALGFSGLIQNNDMIQSTNSFAGKKVYISKLDNAYYCADKRWTVTGTYEGDTTGEIADTALAVLFDGSYETAMNIPANTTAKIRITFDKNEYSLASDGSKIFPGYSYGQPIISYYSKNTPSTPSKVRMYSHYEPHGIGEHEFSFTAYSGDYSDASANVGIRTLAESVNSIVFIADISYIEFEIAAPEGHAVKVTQIEMNLQRPAPERNPFVGKYTAEKLFYPLTAPNFIGKINGHTVDSDVPSDAEFTDTTYSVFRGTEGMSDGTSGLVPAPKASEFGNSYALGSDGNWKDFGQTFVSQSFADGAYATNEALENAVKEIKKYVDTQSSGGVTLDSVYPVGSIYISVNDSFNPNNVFPGTWVSFGKGRTLVGVDRSDLEFQSSEDTGGEKTHTLTVDELPAHNHSVTIDSKELKGSVWNFVGQNANYAPGNSTSGVFSKGGDGTCFYPSATGKATGINDGFAMDATHDHTATSGNTGSGTAHNNMPPYITVYMWKRTE